MIRKKSIMMVAGETSGDTHAAKVIEALLSKNKKLKIFGMGGPAMAKAGMEVREDLTKQALIGFWEVVKHYPSIKRRFDQCVEWMEREKPDLLFLIDYPGFNLRLAEKAYRLGIPVYYYVAPQVWAWHESRLKDMKRVITKLLVILPFEKEFFKKKGMEVVCVGHPLMEEMDLKPVNRVSALKKQGLDLTRLPLIAAMPGSRKGEIKRIWPIFLEASRLLRKQCPDAAFVVPKPQGLAFEDYEGLTPEDPFYFVDAPAFDLRKVCDAAWVKSGTSTLETALLKTPMVVVYKVSSLTGFLAKRLVKIKNVSLVNLLAGADIVTELLQENANPEALVQETLPLLDGNKARDKQLKAFEKIKNSISKPPKASQNIAREILAFLSGRN